MKLITYPAKITEEGEVFDLIESPTVIHDEANGCYTLDDKDADSIYALLGQRLCGHWLYRGRHALFAIEGSDDISDIGVAEAVKCKVPMYRKRAV
jgi:hypothetical protein